LLLTGNPKVVSDASEDFRIIPLIIEAVDLRVKVGYVALLVAAMADIFTCQVIEIEGGFLVLMKWATYLL
jgi:hypothetical protein